MSSMLPWPKEYLAGAAWNRPRRLLDRLVAAARRGVLPGTLMLVGESGLGREGVAIELAAALVCPQAGALFCACPACERVRRGVHPDVAVVDVPPGKSDIAIAQARDITATVAQLPYEGARRVFILASAETPPLNAEAASALLKTLEEPPSHVTFILLVANPTRVLATIVSRSVALRVPWPEEDELLGLVAAVHSCSPEQARALLADGVDAVSALRGAGEDVAGQHRAIGQLAQDLLAGNVLALLRFAAVSRQDPTSVAIALNACVATACESSPPAAEVALEAAARLMQAVRRHTATRVDLEGALVASLAPIVASARRVT